jgi:hypothetical protein
MVIKIKTLPYNSRPRCYFRVSRRRRLSTDSVERMNLKTVIM